MESFDAYADEQLFRLTKEGNRAAFNCIYQRYWSHLFDAAYKRVKSKEAAEDIVQELFTYLWYKRKEIRITHTFSTYIHVALKYKVFNSIRSEINRKKYADAVRDIREYDSNAVEETILFNEASSAIDQKIDRLPARCKQVFILSRRENLTFKEIAGKLDISVSTVEKHMHKALKMLRTNLKD